MTEKKIIITVRTLEDEASFDLNIHGLHRFEAIGMLQVAKNTLEDDIREQHNFQKQ